MNPMFAELATVHALMKKQKEKTPVAPRTTFDRFDRSKSSIASLGVDLTITLRYNHFTLRDER